MYTLHIRPSDIQTIGFYACVVIFLALIIPPSGRRWVKRRFKEWDFMEDYFPLLFTRWQAAIWGGSVLAVAFSWHFITSDWPPYVKLATCVVALFFAGYYVWRTDHIRLLPKFTVQEAKIQPTETNQRDLMNLFIQIIPTCLSDALVYECRGRLLRVCHRYAEDDDWEVTRMDAPLFLGWDYYGSEPMTLEPGVRQRLNVCYWNNGSPRIIVPAVEPLPSKFGVVFDRLGQFKFDIRMTAKDCSPVDIAVIVQLDLREWNKPLVKLISGGHSVRELAETIRISEI